MSGKAHQPLEGTDRSSSASSVKSSISEIAPVYSEPKAYVCDDDKPTERRNSNVASISSSYAGDAYGAINKTTSGTSFESASRRLSRQQTGYTVKDIYGDMDEESVSKIRRYNTNTILDSLSKRVQEVEQSSEGYRVSGKDEEKEISSVTGADRVSLRLKNDGKSLYEDLPDTTVPTKDYGQEFTDIDQELVTWDGPDDPEFPRNWPFKEKVLQTALVAMYTLVSPMTSSICSPAMPEIAAEFGMGTFLKAFSVTVMVLAWAIGPLIIAPISESDKVGRRPVLHVSIWINFAFNLGCGFSQNTAQLCIFRFLGGLGGCAALNVGAGTLADLWDADARLVAMSFYSACPSLGPVISPVILSWIVEEVNWRWCFHFLSIFNGVIAILGAFFFKETYSPALLNKKCKKLKKETGNEHLHTIYEIADGETTLGQLKLTVSRPIKLLTTHPMVIGLGSFMAFTYGFMYLMIVTFPVVFQGKYGYSRGILGLFYIPMGIGFTLGIIFFTHYIAKVYHILTERNGGVSKPEYRLPLLISSGIGIPIGLFWYGWSAEKQLHWIMPSIGTAIFGFLLISVFQTIQNYLIDMNTRFAASSVAAAAVFRSLFGFGFPLFATAMYDRLGYGWGNTLCGFLALLLGVPFPLICLKYGESMRIWANARMDAEQAKRDQKNLERLKRANNKKD